MDLTCLEKKYELENTDLLLQRDYKQHLNTLLTKETSVSDRAVGFMKAITQDAHIEVAPKIPLTC